MTHVLPQLSGEPVVNDGGLETDLIYHHGLELPDFAAFPLVDDTRGRERLPAVLRRVCRDRQTDGRRRPVGDADLAGQRRLGRPAGLRPPLLRRVNAEPWHCSSAA